METFLIRALQLILSFSILVFLHELGHFLFARLFKVRVDKFYMFFNPGFSLLRAKKIDGKWKVKLFAKNVPANERIKLGEDGLPLKNGKNNVMETVPVNELPPDDWRRHPEKTEWGIGWLPLGGYCKISGMIDESMDKTQMSEPVKPWEFRSRPVWQRLPIIIGGVLVNFLLALIIYSAVLYVWGEEYLPAANAKYGFSFSKTLINTGFKNGDKIITVDGATIENVAEVKHKIILGHAKTVAVERNGNIVNIALPDNLTKQVLAAEEQNPMEVRYPFVIDSVMSGAPAIRAHLQKGDSIISINGKEMTIFQDIATELDASKNTTASILFIRNGNPQQAEVQLGADGKLGVGLKTPDKYFQTKKVHYGLLESIPAGISKGVKTLTDYVSQSKLVFSKEGAKQLGGFGTIGKLFPPVWDWQTFWVMTAFLSVILAFMNFLPIPGLDGGYVIFLIYEAVTGHKPSDKFMETATTVGMLLLFALLIYANGNDIFRAMFK